MNNNFRPTWLYIKQHNVTGLKYFGKTTAKDPVKYKGSGRYWNDHLKQHGNKITTLWYELFTDKQVLIEFALKFSKDNNIIESCSWANLIDENGIDGWQPGQQREFKKRKPLSEEHKAKLKTARAKQIITKETRKKISDAKKGKSNGRTGLKLTTETKEKISKANKGKIRSDDAKLRYSQAKKNMSHSTKQKMSNSRLGKKRGSYKTKNKNTNFVEKI